MQKKSFLLSFLFLTLLIGSLHAESYYYDERGQETEDNADWGDSIVN